MKTKGNLQLERDFQVPRKQHRTKMRQSMVKLHGLRDKNKIQRKTQLTTDNKKNRLLNKNKN